MGVIVVSNLIIAIIGVALFVGIALGGALFLGPRFQDAQDNSTASAFVGAVSEVAAAANSYRGATEYAGGLDLATPSTLVSNGYMKTLPSDPLARSGPQMDLVDAQGVDAAAASDKASWSPRFVVWSLGDRRDLCTMIQRKLGTISTSAEVSDAQVATSAGAGKAAGCFRTSSRSSNVASGDYVAYARM